MSDAPRISGYRLVERIGVGAVGSVWLGEETLTGARRAVKILAKHESALAPAGTSRELAGIREYQQKSNGHAALIQVHHVDECAGYFYYVMELADNRAADGGCYQPATLAERIGREAPMPASVALDLTAQLLRGVEHLHQRELLHRDIKPANVLLCNGRVKLGDVGLLTTLDRDVTVCGTPGYIPPDATLDRTADLYAVGIILYEMITGLHRSKFPELPVLAPRTRAERRALHAAIRIANKAAHPDRKQRYATAAAMLHDVERGARRGKTDAGW